MGAAARTALQVELPCRTVALLGSAATPRPRYASPCSSGPPPRHPPERHAVDAQLDVTNPQRRSVLALDVLFKVHPCAGRGQGAEGGTGLAVVGRSSRLAGRSWAAKTLVPPRTCPHSYTTACCCGLSGARYAPPHLRMPSSGPTLSRPPCPPRSPGRGCGSWPPPPPPSDGPAAACRC